ncbi:serine hydrolase [Parasphingopyxis sp.]|uniref:serine hydrolase domain-containing protein n=1 Tax=Parasphingopyxis sp. TaxID=1920299 RepID=UPI00262A8F77|nr:serine hydrolase domain-containing protein [Parasphingopyxis sp.]
MIARNSAEELQAVLDAACADGRIDAGCLAIAGQSGEHACVAGRANVPEDIAATTDTVLHIGSITKLITAELIWRMIVDGALTLEMPVIEAAPELAHIETLRDSAITIGQLLSHTGGLDGDVIFEVGRGPDVLRKFMAEIDEIGSLFTPGDRFSYANVAYNILGRILEVRGGKVYQDALGRHLREDCGLAHIAILPEDKIRMRTAVHFSTIDGELVPSTFGPNSNIASGAVLAMSMPDLARWGVGLLDNAELVEGLTTPVIALPHNYRFEGWGYGAILLDGMGSRLFGHDGGTEGTSSFLRIAPEQKTAWAFAATGDAVLAVYRELEPLLREACAVGSAPDRRPAGEAPTDLSIYEGCYRRHGMRFRITVGEESTLLLRADGDATPPVLDGLVLEPLDRSIFETRVGELGAPTWLSFHEFDDSGVPQLFFVIERMARRTGEAAS